MFLNATITIYLVLDKVSKGNNRNGEKTVLEELIYEEMLKELDLFRFLRVSTGILLMLI